VEHALAKSVLASLPQGPVAFRYFKDRYALQLLAYAASEGRSLSEMRRGRFGPLLQKPLVRRVLGERGGRHVDWEVLDNYFPAHTERYRLTFGLWGDARDWWWNQTTRRGFNLVLQLNFSAAHDRAYRRYICPHAEDHPFVRYGHPVNETEPHTLAWSRIDIDFDTGEALIEEIQSDWVRDAADLATIALANLCEGRLTVPWWLFGSRCDARQAYRYVEHVLSMHRTIWDQAVMAATLWLLRERLCIRDIYMHTHEDGSRLKGIEDMLPPRSVYERVPRSFCFERVAGLPRFLRKARLRRPTWPSCEFWKLRV
jgi:hypothetical protein